MNLQPAGEYLGEEYHRAGGVPAVVAELIAMGLIDGSAITVNGRSLYDNNDGRYATDRDVIKPHDEPILEQAGFLNLKGNLFDSALMKTSVISEDFRERYLSSPSDPNAFEGRAIVFDGPEDYHARIDDPTLALDKDAVLVIRGDCMQQVKADQQGVRELPCIGDGRQSGTSGSPSILNASPEAATGGGLGLLRSGDRIRVDLGRRTADVLLPDAELTDRREALAAEGYPYPESQTPWQEIQRGLVDELAAGMVLKPAVKYQRIARTKGIPRDNH